VAGLVIWVVGRRAHYQDMAVPRALNGVLFAAALFAVGAFIPAVQYWLAEPGDHYMIFFYPLVIGGIWYVVAVPNYFVRASRAKKAALSQPPMGTDFGGGGYGPAGLAPPASYPQESTLPPLGAGQPPQSQPVPPPLNPDIP
jgi:hypothetical protein